MSAYYLFNVLSGIVLLQNFAALLPPPLHEPDLHISVQTSRRETQPLVHVRALTLTLTLTLTPCSGAYDCC